MQYVRSGHGDCITTHFAIMRLHAAVVDEKQVISLQWLTVRCTIHTQCQEFIIQFMHKYLLVNGCMHGMSLVSV